MKRIRSLTLHNSLSVGVIAGALTLSPMSQALASAPAADATPATEGEGEDGGEDEETTTDRAVAAFESGDFDTAITLFEQAFAEEGDPNYLFNIGRVFEEKGDLRSAIDRYQRFVNSPGVDLDSRKFANERLKVLRDIVAAEDQSKAEEEQRKADAEAAKRRQAQGDNAAGDTGPTQADISRKRTRTIGFVLLGVGAAAAGGGGVAGGIALTRHNSFKDETDPDEAATLKEQGQTLSSAADALYITGGVVAMAGLVMVLTTLDDKGDKKSKAGKKSARTDVQPHFGRTGAGLSLTHRF